MITRETLIITGGIVLIVLLTGLGIFWGYRFKSNIPPAPVSLFQEKPFNASLLKINPQDLESLEALEGLDQDLDEMEELLGDSTLSEIEKDLGEFEF